MMTFDYWLEAIESKLYKRIEEYIDSLYENGVEEEEAKRLTTRAFVNDILDMGKPRDRTEDDVSLGHYPPDYRRSATNYIRNYIRLVYQPETYGL